MVEAKWSFRKAVLGLGWHARLGYGLLPTSPTCWFQRDSSSRQGLNITLPCRKEVSKAGQRIQKHGIHVETSVGDACHRHICVARVLSDRNTSPETVRQVRPPHIRNLDAVHFRKVVPPRDVSLIVFKRPKTVISMFICYNMYWMLFMRSVKAIARSL